MGGCNRHRLRCDGKVLILKVAEPGETLGLSAVIGGTRYELTAETSGPCQVKFIGRMVLLKLIERHGELGLHSAQALSHEFQSAYRDIHGLVLSRSSTGKLARLLLSWTNGREKKRDIKIRSRMTHEEMAQMIGSSRETVTRLLSDLKKKTNPPGRFDLSDSRSFGFGSAGCLGARCRQHLLPAA
jgi:CRP/FNR family transcriptional regulator, cyclic AMP receptor protein